MGIRDFVKSLPHDVKRKIQDGTAHWVTSHGHHIVIDGPAIENGRRTRGRVLFEPGANNSNDSSFSAESVNNPTTHSEKLAKALKIIEDKIRYNKTESGHVISHDGKHLWSQNGHSDHVDISEAVRKGLLKGNILTHNHPNGNSFSGPDISMLLSYELREIRAVGPEFVYRMEIPEGFKNSQEQFDKISQILNEEQMRIHNELAEKIRKGKLTTEQADVVFFHEVWKSVSAKTGLKYERRKNDGGNANQTFTKSHGAGRQRIIAATIHQRRYCEQHETRSHETTPRRKIEKSLAGRDREGIFAFLVSKSEVKLMSGIRSFLHKSTSDTEQRKADNRGIRDLLDAEKVLKEGAEHEAAEMKAEKSRSRKRWEDVKRDKEDEYGPDEYFADGKHDSYPLTKDGKPNRKRIIAAWDYIHTEKDGGEYSDAERSRIESRIKAFAKKHFGEELQKSGVRAFAKAKKSHRYAYKTSHRDPIYIPVNRIRDPYQTEKALSEDKIRENMRRMKAGEPLEPVVIGYGFPNKDGERDGSLADCHDGHHRIEAAKRLGHTHVPCVVGGTSKKRIEAADKRYREVWKSRRESTNPPPAVPETDEENVASDYGTGSGLTKASKGAFTSAMS